MVSIKLDIPSVKADKERLTKSAKNGICERIALDDFPLRRDEHTNSGHEEKVSYVHVRDRYAPYFQ